MGAFKLTKSKIALLLSHAQSTQQQKIEAFTKWLDANNFQRKFDIKEFPNQGLGGVATKSIENDEPLLKVPLSKIIFTKDHSNINGWQVCVKRDRNVMDVKFKNPFFF